MTQDTTKLGVEVDDGGTSKETQKKVEELNSVIKESARVTKEARKELKGLLGDNTKGTAGSKKAAEAADVFRYTKQRGAAGLTGASGRDFAAQAQGLDGIVRLYATYAANVFALGAAFTALGNAMETQSMVKGLDQLGAVVGRNLGGLSKRVAELTGGAISMREAMQAVALTSAGGMSAKNIERLAGVARSASLALGVAMPDAINRLSRGITKLEPELLDELGIMTRLDPATQAYARQLGKTVTQLTDFERRQAFANAVLAEGEAKFGAITDISTNPYDKLISALKNLAQTGAEVINKVLAPVASFLSETPTILGGGIIALLSNLIKKAVPEIGEFKQKLSDSVLEAAELAKTRAAQANEAEIRMTRVAKQEAEDRADTEIAAVARAEERIKTLRNGRIRDYKIANSVLDKLTTTGAVDKFDLMAINAIAKRREREKKPEEAAAYREVSKAIKEYAAAHEAAIVQIKKEEEAIINQNKASKTSIAGITRALAVAAEEDAIKKGIVSNAAYNASLIGPTKALTIMNAEITNSSLKLGLWGRTVLQVQGYAAIFAGVLSTLGNALLKLTNAIAIIGTIVTVVSILDSIFSGSRKELDKFKKSAEGVASSVENIDRTIIQLERTMSAGTINGITSVGNALEDLNNNMVETIDSFKKAKKELGESFWNSMANQIAKLYRGDINTTFADSLVKGVRGALDILARSGLKDEYEVAFKEILSVNTLDLNTLKVAVNKLSSEGVEKLQSTLNSATLELKNSDSRTQNFKQSIEAATRAYQQFIQATSNTSPLFRVGAALQNVGVSMFQTSVEVKLGLEEINAEINHLSEIPEAGIIFGPDFIENLVSVKDEFVGQNKAISAYRKALIDLDKQIDKTKTDRLKGFTSEAIIKQTRDRVKELTKTKEEIEKGLAILTEQQSEKARRLFNEGLNTAFTKGAEIIRVSLGQAMEKGAIAIGKAAIAGLSGAERARSENALAKQELDIQLRAIQTNVDLILSQALLRASIDKSTASNNLNSAKEAGKSATEIKALESIEQASDIFYKIIKEGKTPNFANISSLTSDEDVVNRVRASGIADSQRLAEQNEAKVLLDAQRKALGISGAINIRSGKLEDEQKSLNLQQQISQNDTQRVNALNTLIGLTSEITAKDQANIEKNIILLRQQGELLAIETAIANAGGNAAEVRKQEEYKVLILSKHERELELQNITSSQRIIQATIESLIRHLDLVKAINDNNYKAGVAQTDILNAQNSAYNTLYGASSGFAAIQNEIVGTQRAQLEYVKLIGDAQIALFEKETKAKQDLQRLDPVRDAEGIATINKELERQNNLTKVTISNARIQLSAQEKMLEVTKKAAIQQDRYNRILNNSTKVADSLAKAFGDFGSALGTIAEAFATMTVNTDKNTNELLRIRKEQQGLSKDDEKYIALEDQYNLQRSQYTQDRLAGFASIAGASKNLFEEQSEGYRFIMAIEKALYIAHIAMALKQMAVDAVKTETAIARNVAEAESSGVLAVIKSMASLPFPFNIAAGVAVAGIVAAVLATVGGSGPSVSGSAPQGVTADEIQGTQGTGRTYKNGALQDTMGGALGSTERVNDIANSLDLIESHTELSSSFAVKTILSLKAIEKNTKDLAADVFKTTNVGKLTSGFGTVEKALSGAGTGLLSSLIPSTSKSVEIIDKGISVLGTLSQILTGTASLSEYETVQTTKQKSGFLGLGAKTKINISTNTKELSNEAEETIISLFSNLATTAVSASKEVLGSANTEIEKVLQDFTISFKASGMGLSGEQFAEAILAESSVVMNEIISKAVPELDSFRKLGEGFTSTLLRMATTVEVVNDKFDSFFGIDFESIATNFSKVTDTTINSMNIALDSYNNALMEAVNTTNSSQSGIKEPSISQLDNLNLAEQELSATRNKVTLELGGVTGDLINNVNEAQKSFTKAKLAIIDNKDALKDFQVVNKLMTGELSISTDNASNSLKGINAEVINLYNATIDLNSAMQKASDLVNNQKLLNLSFYNALVEQLGGLEAFIEKTDYFAENFYSEADQLDAKTKQVVKTLQNFVNEGILSVEQFSTLTDGLGNAREEYKTIIGQIFEQGISSEAGRNALNVLLTYAPKVVEVTEQVGDGIKNLAEDFNIGYSTFSTLVNDAILGKLDASTLGEEIASTIKEGFYSALAASFVTDVTNTIVNQLITPILTGVINLTTINATLATGMINTIVEDITAKANALATLMSNPNFKQALSILTTAVTQSISTINSNAKELDFTFSDSKLQDYLSEFEELSKTLDTKTIENLIEQEQTRLDLLETQADTLKESSQRLRDFSKNLSDFKASLLTGNLSPLTPLQQYSSIKSQLDSTILTATTSTSSEDRLAALDKVQELSSKFLEISRLVYSSGDQYTTDFNYVQTILDTLIDSTGTQASIEEQQLNALNIQIEDSKQSLLLMNKQIDSINNVNDSAQAIQARLLELTKLMDAEYNKANTNITESFTVLDKNLDNVLSIEELKSSGLASDNSLDHIFGLLDTNGDGQLTRLETLIKSSNNTYYTLESIQPILQNISSGIYDVNNAIAIIGEINKANVSSGGSSIGGTFAPSSSSDLGYNAGAITSALGGYIKSGIVHGIDGQTISLSEAKNALQSYISQTESGQLSARDVYNTLQSWGVNSSMTAGILGVSKQQVLDWFQYYDSAIPAFAKGINFVPEDMLAEIHTGERILPEADNRELMQHISNRNGTNEALIKEIQNLNKKVEDLQRIVAEGAIMNVEATDRNANQISLSVVNSSEISTHTSTIQKKVAIKR